MIFAALTAFAACLSLVPLCIVIGKKRTGGQPILGYVDNHMSKKGTPTMGGIAFILSLLTVYFFVHDNLQLMTVALTVTVAYGAVGFADDFIKLKFAHNKGLSAWQKIVFQLIIAIVVSLFAYYFDGVGGEIFLPFKLVRVDLNKWACFFYVFIFLAFTNSVNLTDGLDGLASSVTIVFLLFAIAFIMFAVSQGAYTDSASMRNLCILLASAVGALAAFLIFNAPRASIFMGDTGSMALGGLLAATAVLSQMALSVLLVGAMYIVTSVSVLVQVIYFKLTKKRVFLMAPLHHHFERKGYSESKIDVAYSIVTFIMGLFSLALFYGLNG